MKQNEPVITIEWRHIEQGGETCTRCSDTGAALRRAATTLTECGCVEVRVIETKLESSAIDDSNSIYVNGQRIEDVVPELNVVRTECSSCGELVGAPVSCRAVQVQGESFEGVPEKWLRTAICRVAQCCN